MAERYRQHPGFTRRDIIKFGAASATAILPGAGFLDAYAQNVAFTPFERDLPIPPVLAPTTLSPAP